MLPHRTSRVRENHTTPLNACRGARLSTVCCRSSPRERVSPKSVAPRPPLPSAFARHSCASSKGGGCWSTISRVWGVDVA